MFYYMVHRLKEARRDWSSGEPLIKPVIVLTMLTEGLIWFGILIPVLCLVYLTGYAKLLTSLGITKI